MIEQKPEFGSLFAKDNKKHAKSPDYTGKIAIDLQNLTAVGKEGGLHIFRLSGWKKRGPSGKTYLSLSIDRYEKRDDAPQPQRATQDDDDFPF
jgi:hypothetical protein